MSTVKTAAQGAEATNLKVRELFDLVQFKKAALVNATKPCWNTSCSFGYSPNATHDRIDLKIITDIRKLVEIHAFIMERYERFDASAKNLGVNKSFTWLGFTAQEWEKDIQIRVDQLNFQEKSKELSSLETRLSGLISPELKAQLELEAISKLLGV